MDINKIKELVNSGLPTSYIEQGIIEILAHDESVIPTMMKILEAERKFKSEMSMDMNLLLSKADTALDQPKINKDNFIQDEIIEFYKKYKGHTGHCFKNLSEKLKEPLKENKTLNDYLD